MVAPLIVGAAKVARTKRSLRKAEKAKIKKNPIAHQRQERMHAKEAIHNRPRKRHPSEDEKREENVRRVRDILPYRKALRAASKGSNTFNTKKMKALRRGVTTLGSVLYPMGIQSIFAILVLISLAVEDDWWGWVVPGITMASITWIVAVILGTYTMFIATFRMGMYFKHWKVILAFVFCFSANWAPGLQIVPWVAIWILFIVLHEK